MNSADIQKILDEQKQQSKIHLMTERQISSTIVANQRDDVYNKKLHQGIAKRDNTYQAISNARPEVQAKISETMSGLKKTAEHDAKVAAKNKERGIPCITPLGIFRTGALAGLAYNEYRGVTNGKNAVNGALKKGKPGYKYISIEEYIMLTGREI
jgi:hypothetical protein